jgi:hypothetical protein
MLALLVCGCGGFKALPGDGGPDAADRGTIDGACGGLSAASTALTVGPAGSGSLTSALLHLDGRVAAVWEDLTGGGKVWLALLSPDGSPIGSPTAIGTDAYSPAAAVAGQEIAVVYHQRTGQGIVLKRFDRDGKELASRSLVATVDPQAGYPKIAHRAGRYAVAYFDGADATGFQTHLGLFNADGSAARAFAQLADTMKSTALVDLTATDTGYAAVWTDERQGDRRIYAARLADDGAKLPPGDLPLTSGSGHTFPTVASREGHREVCYSADHDGGTNPEIECVHVDAANTVGQPLRVTSASGVSSFPKTMWSAARFVVVWGDEGFGLGKILMRQLHLDGRADGSNTTLTNFTATSGYPSAAWLGDGFGLGWYQYSKGAWSYVYQSYPCR